MMYSVWQVCLHKIPLTLYLNVSSTNTQYTMQEDPQEPGAQLEPPLSPPPQSLGWLNLQA